MPEELVYLQASHAAELIRKKALSAVELVRTIIDRIDALDPKLNALPHGSDALAVGLRIAPGVLVA